VRRWYVVVSAALGYALSWLVGDEPMDALVTAALAGVVSFLIVEYFNSDGADGSSTDPIGGNGPQLLTLAANEADIVGLTGITFRRGGMEPDRSAWKAAVVDDRVQLVREAAGDRYERLELNALLRRVIVTDDRRKAAEELTRRSTQ